MKTFAEIILNMEIKPSSVGIFFMGQAGFILKDSKGHLIAYDLYLSDCCEREFGFKRMLSKLLQADELIFDVVICSHGHYDHLDIDSIATLTAHQNTVIYTTNDGIEELLKLGITKGKRIERKQTISICNGEVKVHFTYCDHGELAPHAVGAVFEIEGKRLYFAGDTAYRPTELVADKTSGCDFAALPINGAFGNMNEEQAVNLAKELNAKVTVPCHFWNFAEHGGDPAKFMALAKKAEINYLLMAQGECFICI